MYKVLLIVVIFLTTIDVEADYGWKRLSSETNLFLYGVCFVDSLNGWVVGDKGIILKTTDGGNSWIEKEANIGSWLLSVHFIDRNNGWVCGDFGDLRKTTDGGETWRYVPSIVYPDVLNSIYFVDENNVWAVGPKGIIHSSDGGQNWSFQYGDSIQATKSIYFINRDVGWCSGANGEILHTVDGGLHWERQLTPTTGIIYDVFFLNFSIGWAVSRNEPQILKTTDGGNTWFIAKSNVDGFYKRIQFVDELNGWAAGPDGIIRTTDGGLTWKKQMSQSKYNIWWAYFVDKNRGWAVGGDGTILKTDNGGYSFFVDFRANVTTGTAPFSTSFTNLTVGDYNSLLWDFGDGGTHKAENPVYVYQKPGRYDVKLVVSDGYERDSLIKYNYVTVEGADELIADFEADTTEGVEPLMVRFSDLSRGNPDQWFWDFGDGGTHSIQNPLYIYQSSGTYTVKLTVKRNGDEDSEIKTNYIKVRKAVGVEEYNGKVEVLVKPNPMGGNFGVSFYNLEECNLVVELVDLTGKTIGILYNGFVEKGFANFNFENIDFLNNCSDGSYFLLFKFISKDLKTEIVKRLIFLR